MQSGRNVMVHVTPDLEAWHNQAYMCFTQPVLPCLAHGAGCYRQWIGFHGRQGILHIWAYWWDAVCREARTCLKQHEVCISAKKALLFLLAFVSLNVPLHRSKAGRNAVPHTGRLE
eukprot:1157087-Pelagomonas_calceolata.AAC.9